MEQRRLSSIDDHDGRSPLRRSARAIVALRLRACRGPLPTDVSLSMPNNVASVGRHRALRSSTAPQLSSVSMQKEASMYQPCTSTAVNTGEQRGVTVTRKPAVSRPIAALPGRGETFGPGLITRRSPSSNLAPATKETWSEARSGQVFARLRNHAATRRRWRGRRVRVRRSVGVDRDDPRVTAGCRDPASLARARDTSSTQPDGRRVQRCQAVAMAATWRWSVPQQPPTTCRLGSWSRRAT